MPEMKVPQLHGKPQQTGLPQLQDDNPKLQDEVFGSNDFLVFDFSFKKTLKFLPSKDQNFRKGSVPKCSKSFIFSIVSFFQFLLVLRAPAINKI